MFLDIIILFSVFIFNQIIASFYNNLVLYIKIHSTLQQTTAKQYGCISPIFSLISL